MTIENRHIIDCPEHGLFYSPDYWPCPFCFLREPVQKGPMGWSTSWIMWKGEERKITLHYRETADPGWQKFVMFVRRKDDRPAA